MYGNMPEMRELALASLVLYILGLFVDCPPKKAAWSVPLRCRMEINPRTFNSFSRRSVMAISVGHFKAMSPSSVLKVWAGKPATSAPPSTPRRAAHHLYNANALLTRCARAYAEFPHRYLLWSLPSTSSTKLKPSTGTVSGPKGRRRRTWGRVSTTYRESSDSRNERHLTNSVDSKPLARSLGMPSSVKLSISNSLGLVATMNGA